VVSAIRFSLLALLFLAEPISPAFAQQNVGSDTVATRQSLQLAPGDLLKVTVWREEDLSGEFLINEDGFVVLPLLGERRVVGRPFAELRESMLVDFRAQLRNPSIDITPLRRIHVLGEVRDPGLYKADPTVSLAGIIAMAGGATPSGDLDKIRVFRDGQIRQERITPHTTLETANIRSNDQIFVEPRSWFERNIPFVVSVMFSVTGIVLQLLR